MNCGGTYVVSKPPKAPGQKKVLEGMRRLLAGTSEMSKSQGTVQDSDSDELLENATVAKPNAEGKLLSLVGGRNTKSPGSSSLKKAGKRNMPDDSQKAIVLPAAPLKILKPIQEFAATGKHELLPTVSCNEAKSLGSSSSKKAGKRNRPEDFQKAIVLSSAPRRKVKPKQEFVASEKHELFSIGSCNDANSPGSSSEKVGKRNMPEGFQKTIVPLAASLSKLKPKQQFVATGKHELFSIGSCNNEKAPRSSTSRRVDKWHKPEDVQKSSVQSAAPQKKLKLEKYGGFSLRVYKNAKPLGSSRSRKAGEWHTEDVKKSSGPLAAPKIKLKLEQDCVASEKRRALSLGGCSNAKPPVSSTSRKAGKLHKPDDVEKSNVLPAAPQKKLKLVQELAASARHGVAKPPGSSTANKVGKLHKPEGIQKACVLPAAPLRKLNQDLVASEKNELSCFVGYSNANVLDSVSSKKAHKQHEHEETQKATALPAASQSVLEQSNKTSSSIKKGKQYKPDSFQKTVVQPAVSQTKLKQSNRVAPKRQETKRKTRKFAREKEYAVISVWQNIYESECSSGSTEPLVNKRTERRKRERERLVQITYSQSRKRSTSGICSIKAQPPAEDSSRQAKPPSPCLDIIVIEPADQVVTQMPGDQAQPPAPCLDIVVIPPADQAMIQTPGDQFQALVPCSVATDQVVPLQSADPPVLIPSNPSSSPDVIDISDDD